MNRAGTKAFLGVILALLALNSVTPASAEPISLTEARASQWYLDALGITKAHAVSKGEGVSICLIDSGVVPTHPALVGAHLTAGQDFSGQGSPDGFTPVGLQQDHGTAMAGLIGAQGTDGGYLGSAPGAEIISVSTVMPADTMRAFAWCADRGVKVISVSLASGVQPEAIRYAQARDVVVVAGSGNGYKSDAIASPANYFGVLSVAGVTSELKADPMTSTSGYVEFTPGDVDARFDRQGVAIVGPSSVTSAPVEDDCVGYFSANLGLDGFDRGCGSSNATAVVAGVVALVRAKHPELNAANVINRILKTATPPADGSPVPSPKYGWGIINAEKAVSAEVPLVDANPLGSSYTGSYGLWNPAVKPTKAEPPVGAKLPPADVKAEITGEPWDTAVKGAESGSRAGGIPTWAYAAGGAALLVLLGVIGAIMVRARARRGNSA